VTDEAKAGVAVQELATAVADAVEQAIIGKREAVELVMFACSPTATC
jgi:formaldehyde-activating enzyme involved in methanogenesis